MVLWHGLLQGHVCPLRDAQGDSRMGRVCLIWSKELALWRGDTRKLLSPEFQGTEEGVERNRKGKSISHRLEGSLGAHFRAWLD